MINEKYEQAKIDKEILDAFAPNDPSVPVMPTAEAPKVTLDALLTAMQLFDQGLAVKFDPETVVGDLREKVDAIKTVIDRLEFQAEWAKQQAAPFMEVYYAVQKNVERLKEYVRYSMEKNGFQELPGNKYRVQLQDNPPALEITRPEATAMDYQKYPSYCKQIRFYEWDKPAIKAALLDKHEFPFAKLSRGKHCRFYVNPPADGTKQKKVKAK